MDHQSFRYYIPGIIFLFPIYFVTCWMTVNNYTNSDVRVFVLVGGITTFPVISLPIGWWIYNTYRVWWLLITNGGYENKDFVKLIRKDTKPFYSPANQAILIDCSHVKGIESWIQFDLDIFRKTFCPFTTKKKFQSEIERKGVYAKFTEPLSDFVLFKDTGYDYARSNSSVRYVIECSLYALLTSFMFAKGIWEIWLFQLQKTNNVYVYYFWIATLTCLSTFIVISVFIRWRIADREYDARLLLTTVTSLKSNYFVTDSICNKIPLDVVNEIEKLCLVGKPYAAFDLDNTLLIDDIGEAVFALLVKREIVRNFSWNDYLELLEKDRGKAYLKVIEIMNGIKLSVLVDITKEILDSQDSCIEIENSRIPIPKPNPVMQSIVSLLFTKGIDVVVVTASNEISAKLACWKYFGISSSKVFGAPVDVNKRNRIVGNSLEIPFGEGKVKILKDKFKDKPVLTSGDAPWDRYLLDYTIAEGVRLWLGRDKAEYRQLKETYFMDKFFYHLS